VRFTGSRLFITRLAKSRAENTVVSVVYCSRAVAVAVIELTGVAVIREPKSVCTGKLCSVCVNSKHC